MIPTAFARLAEWQRGSVHRRVASAAAIVAVFTFGAKIAGAAKEMVVAYHFGTSDQVDAFVVATILPGFVITLIGGSLNTALIPVYVEVRHKEGPGAGQRLLSTTMVVSIALLLVAVAILAALLPTVLPLIGSHFAPWKLRLTTELSYLLLPSLILSGITTTWSAVLNAHGRFAAPAGAGLGIPLASIAAVLVLGHAWGIMSLVAGMLGGYCAEAVCVGLALRREGLSLLPHWSGLTAPVRRVAAQYAPMAAGMLVMGTNPLIDQIMAARLSPGSVASLGYGSKLVGFAMGIGSVSLSSAVFPHFSGMAAARDWSGLDKAIRAYARIVMAAAIPATLLAIVLSEPIVRTLFERGAFTADDTRLVGRIQAFYLAQVPFHLTGMLFVRFISATGGNHVLMWISIINAFVNVTANYVLSAFLGPAGIALSTSLVYAISFTLAFAYTRRRLRALRNSAAVEPILEIT